MIQLEYALCSCVPDKWAPLLQIRLRGFTTCTVLGKEGKGVGGGLTRREIHGGGLQFYIKGIYRCAAGRGILFRIHVHMNGYHFHIKNISMGYLFHPKSIWMGTIWKIVYEWVRFSIWDHRNRPFEWWQQLADSCDGMYMGLFLTPDHEV